jgi:hypothetical protein
LVRHARLPSLTKLARQREELRRRRASLGEELLALMQQTQRV